jgi:hypothetical protein
MCSSDAAESLLDTDLSTLAEDELADRVLALLAEQNRIAAELTHTVRVAEARQLPEREGLTSMTNWLVGHARMHSRAASRLVRNGRALAQLPAMKAAFRSGAVGADQVTVVAKVVAPEHVAAAADQGVDVGDVDHTLTEVAASQPYEVLATTVHHYLERLDPDGPEPDPTEKRSLRMTRHSDGSVSGWFDLDAVGGAKVATALESIVQAGRGAGDDRTRAQQAGDALVQLCDLALASGELPVLRTRKPQVGVLVPIADLVDPGAGPATAKLETGGVISAARARWLTCDGEIGRIVMSPDGVPLDLGRTKRVVDPYLRKAVDLRDGGCVFAGCTAPAWWCEAHHLLEWLFGGETTVENLALLCERHHAKVHSGFRVERRPDGRYRTYRPDGTEILIGPLLRAAA